MDYATLIADKNTLGSIANWVNYSDAKIPVADILLEAQAFINNRLRVKEMLAIGALPVVANALNAARPAGLVAIQKLQTPDPLTLKPRDLSSVMGRRAYNTDGSPATGYCPQFYALAASTIEFDIAPASALTLTYTAFFAAPTLSAQAPTNFLTTKYPHLLRPAILAFVADFLNDDAKYNRYLARYQAMEQTAMQADDMDALGMQVDPDYSEAVI